MIEKRIGEKNADGTVMPELNVRGQAYLREHVPATYSLGNGYFVVLPVNYPFQYDAEGKIINPEIVEARNHVSRGVRTVVKKADDES